jgi:hypothetical protein
MLPFLGDRHFAFRRGTLGHVILAVNQGSFDDSFQHELVHVRRYVWFGPFFVPAYLLSSDGIGLLAKTTTWTIPLKNKRDDIPDYHRAGCISLQAYCVECGKKVSA